MKGFLVYLIIVACAVGWATFATLSALDGLIEPQAITQESDQ